MRNIVVCCALLLSFSVNAQMKAFNASEQPPAPDYSNEKHWSALPFRKDAADKIPNTETWVSDSLKDVDVFYIYPTIYRSKKTWTADVNNKKLNKRIDNKPIKYQASVFNASARVYAPRYRQAAIAAFYDKGTDGTQALDFAYEDVKRAFQYYLDHYNQGRPIIIASHSQGTRHSRQLMKDFFDGTTLQNKLVAAYIIGFGIDTAMYKTLRPCENENQTGCYITWASFKKGYDPGNSQLYGNICVNPITWNRDTIAVDCSKSQAAILLNFNKKYNNACGAQIHNGYLWVNNTLPFVRGFDNLHIADYNLFWYDIRANVPKRIGAFWKQ